MAELDIADQSAAISIINGPEVIADQSAAVGMFQPYLGIADQYAMIAMLAPENTERRQFYLM